MQRRRSTLGTCFGLLAARLKPKRRCVRPRAVIRRSPKHGTIFSDLLDEQGRSEAAIDCLRRALQAAPEYADAMFNLALLLRRGSRHKEAAECWRQYLGNELGERGRRRRVGERRQKISAGKFHFEPPFTSFDHLVGAGKRLARARNRSSAREMLNARWQYCPSAHFFLPDRRQRGREIPVVEAPNRNAKLMWT
jgi:tetratricopeptide (TPR) repeat protein